MNWQSLLNPEICGRICLTLVHSLWQVTLLAVLAWLVSRIEITRRIERSYVVFTVAMLLSIAAMPLTYYLLKNPVRTNVSVPLATRNTAQRHETTSPIEVTTAAMPRNQTAEPKESYSSTTPIASPGVSQIQPTSSATAEALSWTSVAPWIVALYSIGVFAMLMRLAHAIWGTQRFAAKATIIRDGVLYQLMQSLSRQWSLKVVPVLAEAEQIVVPKVIGLVRPMILLPGAALSNLTPDELAMILAHELAHVRRFDLWVNLFQRLAETVLFFNPALWYLSRRISTLREYCCDGLVCRTATESTATHKLRYAQALLRVAELHCGPATKCASSPADLMALAAQGKSASELRRRIAHLFGEPLQEPLRITRGGLLTLTMVALLLCIGLAMRQSNAGSDTASTLSRTAKTTEDDTTTTEINPEKQERATLSGQIVMEDGSPAKVKGWLESVTSYRTDANSTKSIHATEDECLDRFNVKIVAGTVWLTYFPTDHAFAWLGPFEVKPGEKLENLKIVLSEGYSAPIRVLDEHGKPVANASLQKFPKVGDAQSAPWNQTLTNQNGECVLEHLADVTYALDIKASGFEPLRIEPRKLEPNQTVSLTMIASQPAGGIIVGPDGAPIAGAKIRFRGERIAKGRYSGGGNDFGDAWATTDETGRFSLNELTKSSYYLFITEAPDKSRVVVQDIQAGKLDTRIEIPKRQDLRIRILGDLESLHERDGKRFVSVRQVVPFNTPDGNYQDLIGNDVYVTPTSEGGQATYRGLVQGTVRVEAGSQSQTFDVAKDGITEVVLQLKTKPTSGQSAIMGRIVLEDGTPATMKGSLYSDVVDPQGNSYFGLESRDRDHFSVEVHPGTVWLSYFPKGFAPAWLGPLDAKPNEVIENLKIVLTPGHSAPLKIVNKGGTAIEGAKIVVHPVIGNHQGGPVHEKFADGNGEFLLEHLADSKYSVEVTASGYEPLRIDSQSFEPNKAVTLTMIASKLTRGVVLNHEGLPVEEAKIYLRCEQPREQAVSYRRGDFGEIIATTDPTGKFTLDQLAQSSRYLMIVETPDGSRAIVKDIRAGEEERQIRVPQRRDLHVRFIGDLHDLPQRAGKRYLQVQQHIPLETELGNTNGLIGKEINLKPTADGGEASYHGLVEGTVRITAGGVTRTVDVVDDGITEVVLQLKPKLKSNEAAIMGRIVLEDGTPATTKGWAATVSSEGQKQYMIGQPRFQDVFSVKVPAGKTWLKYFPDNYAPTWAGPLELKPGQVLADVVLTLKPGTATTVQVQNEAGERIPNAKVIALPIMGGDTNGDPSNAQQTNDQGEYVYEHLAAIDYEFKAMAPGYEPLSTKVMVTGKKASVTLTMTRSNPTTGRVLMPDGSPAADAKFYLLWRGINGGHGGANFSYDRVIATTDADGNFSLDELRRADTYTLVVQAADNSRLLLKKLRAGEKNLKLEIPPRRDLKVRIVGDLKQLSKPRGKLSLQIWQPITTTGTSGGFQGSAPITPTSEGGEALFEGLLEGEVKVTVGDQEQTVPVSSTRLTEMTFQLGEPPAKPAGSKTSAKAATNRHRFELQIIGPDGKPVPEAMAEFRTGNIKSEHILQGKYLKKQPYGTLVQADATGTIVALRPKKLSTFSIGIEQPGFAPYWLEWDAREHPEAIPDSFMASLDAAWTVGGVLVDSEGQPLEGVQVRPSIQFKKRPGDTSQLGVGKKLKTDAAGRWSYPSVPISIDRVFVEIDHPDFMPVRRPLARQEFEITVGSKTATKIELQPGLSIAGTVTDETGRPLSNVLVRTKFMNDVREASTNDAGKYRLVGCEPKMARVVVSAPGRATDMQDVLVDPVMKPVDFSMKPGGKVRIRVLDEKGEPVPRACIFFQRWRTPMTQYFEFNHVNQYANQDGIWEWNEAPLDEFKADICRPDGMQLLEQSLLARNEEYVFRVPPTLVLSGKVIDAETKLPIQKFLVVPGARWSNGEIFWDRGESYSASGGRYEMRRNRGELAHLIRIEADGYQVAVSREIKSDEGNVELDFELKKAENTSAKIVTPDGKPAAGAQVALGIAGSQIMIRNGEFTRQTFAARYDADKSGVTGFPTPNSAFQLVVLHPTGFAHYTSDAPFPKSITLTPWAKISGTFRVGEQPAKNVELAVHLAALDAYGPDQPSISTSHEASTDDLGHFQFDRVFPGKGRIGRNIVFMVNDGAQEVTSSQRVPIQCVAGETTKISLGGTGRPVIGKMVPAANQQENVFWNFARVRVQGELPPLSQNPTEKERAAYDAAVTKRAFIIASVDREGNFRIDDLPPGNYELSVQFSNHSAGSLSGVRFTVPPIEGTYQKEPLDLGTLQLKEPADSNSIKRDKGASSNTRPKPTITFGPNTVGTRWQNLLAALPHDKPTREELKQNPELNVFLRQAAESLQDVDKMVTGAMVLYRQQYGAEKTVEVLQAAYDKNTVPLDKLLEAQRRQLDATQALGDALQELSRTGTNGAAASKKEKQYALFRVRAATKARNQALQTWRSIYEKHQKQHAKDKALAKVEADARGQYFYFRERLQQAEAQLAAFDQN